MDRKYIVTVFVDTGDKTEEWAEFAKEHTADLIKVPGFLASRAYLARGDYVGGHPETFGTRPPYDLMTYYEVDDEGLHNLTTVRREAGDAPKGGTRPFPSPLGPYVGHSYLWEALADENRKPEQ